MAPDTRKKVLTQGTALDTHIGHQLQCRDRPEGTHEGTRGLLCVTVKTTVAPKRFHTQPGITQKSVPVGTGLLPSVPLHGSRSHRVGLMWKYVRKDEMKYGNISQDK